MIKRPHRRALLGGVVSLASAIMFASEAAHGQQQVSLRHIGVLLVGWSCEGKELQEFRHGLRDAGYADGRDVVIECRSAKGDFNQIPKLATDIVKGKADVIVADSTLATRAFKRATSTIPIVMARVADPVGSGLVASLSHPGGNVTGLSLMVTELSAKRLELLKEAIPQLTRVAVLRNPATPWHPKVIEALRAAAPSMSIELSVVGAETADELDLAPGCKPFARPSAVCDRGWLIRYTSNETSQAGIQGQTTNDVREQGVCGRGCADVVWTERWRFVPRIR